MLIGGTAAEANAGVGPGAVATAAARVGKGAGVGLERALVGGGPEAGFGGAATGAEAGTGDETRAGAGAEAGTVFGEDVEARNGDRALPGDRLANNLPSKLRGGVCPVVVGPTWTEGVTCRTFIGKGSQPFDDPARTAWSATVGCGVPLCSPVDG